MKKIELTGERFSKLLVVEYSYSRNGKAYWKCVCQCGKEVIVEGFSLRSGHTKSCGCLRKIDGLEPRYRHGYINQRLYKIWSNMKTRCTNPNHPFYKDYGGRGITYCSDWDDFVLFKEWAFANGYNDDLSIDRINVNGNYVPENCRWVDMKTQNRNRRNNHLITFNGETHCISEWAEITGIKRETIKSRLKYGWSIEKVLTTNVKNQ